MFAITRINNYLKSWQPVIVREAIFIFHTVSSYKAVQLGMHAWNWNFVVIYEKEPRKCHYSQQNQMTQ